MPELIKRVVALGARRPMLEAVLVGGASMFAAIGGSMEVGARNEAAVKAQLAAARIRVHASATGGTRGRTVRVDPKTGIVTGPRGRRQGRPALPRNRQQAPHIEPSRRWPDMARVLVVDDAAFMRKMVSDALAKAGHEVIGEACNGVEAVESFRALKPELTTLDITMPEKDGLSALGEIMTLDPNARVIMCSALGQESKVLESIKLGARDFVVKPFQPARVQEAVEKALA